MSMGFEQSQADATLYGLKRDGNFILLLAYVDDILIFSNTQEMGYEVIKQFAENFKIRESNEIDSFLDLSILDEGN